jgi:ribosomal protein S12 methylthiotransferase
MEVQAAISRERLQRFRGRRLEVLIDEIEYDEDGTMLGAIARSAASAPEIDGSVFVKPHATLKVGEFAQVRITSTTDHDMRASVVAG